LKSASATDTIHPSCRVKIGQAFVVAKYVRKDARPKVAKTLENRNRFMRRGKSRWPGRHAGVPNCRELPENGQKQSRRRSDADGTRTRNHRIDSPGL
jgi:hypothetical protein